MIQFIAMICDLISFHALTQRTSHRKRRCTNAVRRDFPMNDLDCDMFKKIHTHTHTFTRKSKKVQSQHFITHTSHCKGSKSGRKLEIVNFHPKNTLRLDRLDISQLQVKCHDSTHFICIAISDSLNMKNSFHTFLTLISKSPLYSVPILRHIHTSISSVNSHQASQEYDFNLFLVILDPQIQQCPTVYILDAMISDVGFFSSLLYLNKW